VARISTSGICLALLVLLALACHTDDPLSPAPEPNLASPLGPDSSSTSIPDVPQVSIADPPSLLVPTAGPDPTSTPSSRDTWEDHVIITGLEAPTDMEFSSDQRLFVAEQNGKIRIIQNGKLLPSPLLTLPVDSRDGRGLMGLTLDPDFEINRHFYVYYTRAIAPPQNRVSRFTVRADDPNLADPGSELVILDGIPAAIRHNGGIMQFGPDGKPYIGAGDALTLQLRNPWQRWPGRS
jgi:glucose/arabinose dehydrogenase